VDLFFYSKTRRGVRVRVRKIDLSLFLPGVSSEVSAGVKEQLEAVGGAISSEFVSDKAAGAMEKNK